MKQLDWTQQIKKKYHIQAKQWPKWYYGKPDLKHMMYHLMRDGFGFPETPTSKENPQ